MKRIAEYLGTNIRRRRSALGMTQEDLADGVGVSVETIRNIEKGRKWVTTKTISRMAKALRTHEVLLFENTESGSWTRLLAVLAKIPPDVLEALYETVDWDSVRQNIKRSKRRETRR